MVVILIGCWICKLHFLSSGRIPIHTILVTHKPTVLVFGSETSFTGSFAVLVKRLLTMSMQVLYINLKKLKGIQRNFILVEQYRGCDGHHCFILFLFSCWQVYPHGITLRMHDPHTHGLPCLIVDTYDTEYLHQYCSLLLKVVSQCLVWFIKSLQWNCVYVGVWRVGLRWGGGDISFMGKMTPHNLIF